MALPPVHRIDHDIVFIHEDDGAWDRERIKYEIAVMEGKRDPEQGRPVPEGKRTDHPWIRYVGGRSRGDLRTAEEYLAHRDGELGPTRFRFARIPFPSPWANVKALQDGGMLYDAKLLAIRSSLTSVTGLELEGGKKGEPLTNVDLQRLRAMVGDEVFEFLGTFAIHASRELTESEKKS